MNAPDPFDYDPGWTPEEWTHYPEIATGVYGEIVELVHSDGTTWLFIETIVAKQQGNGDVGRYLDSIPLTKTVVLLPVLSRRLAGMLERRHYECLDGATWIRRASK